MKSLLYNLVINDLSRHCYENCLNYFPQRSAVLDVGIGNGAMLRNFHPLIRSKNLRITGIDINRYYLEHCRQLIEKYGLQDNITIYRMPVEEYEPAPSASFDFILFSMSFMLFKDQDSVLERTMSWLKPGGKIIFFQTIHKDRFPLMEFIKPKLKYLTTVEFGKVTYEHEFRTTLQEHNLQVDRDNLIKKAWYGGEYRMLITSIGAENEAN